MFHGVNQIRFVVNLSGLLVMLVLITSCVQAPSKPPLPADQSAVSKGIEILQDNEIEDKSTALLAFKTACDLGNNYGCHQIGMAYVNGLYGAEKNTILARKWFLDAANRGYFPSQQNLANLHALKLVDPANDVEGYKWIILASNGARVCTPKTAGTEGFVNRQDAKRVCQLALQGQSRIRSILRNRLTAQGRQKADSLANSWLQKHSH